MDQVKADWMREMGAVLSNPDAIRHGLENLPAERVPNVLQFRSICMDYPKPYVKPELLLRGPVPEATAEEKARVRALLNKARRAVTGVGYDD